MRAHPALYWAKFYLSRRSHTYDGIENLLSIQQLGGITAGELQQLDLSSIQPRGENMKNLKTFLVLLIVSLLLVSFAAGCQPAAEETPEVGDTEVDTEDTTTEDTVCCRTTACGR